MWFSPWRRILRGRSGDAKPSGLRAGTKFVEEDTGVEYTYDPVMQNWKKKTAPYSAIVCKDGSTVWAEDASGKTIASGEAGVDDASVIQSAVSELLNKEGGKLFIDKGTYLISEDITIDKAGMLGLTIEMTERTILRPNGCTNIFNIGALSPRGVDDFVGGIAIQGGWLGYYGWIGKIDAQYDARGINLDFCVWPFIIDNVKFAGLKRGALRMATCWDIYLTRCRFFDCGDDSNPMVLATQDPERGDNTNDCRIISCQFASHTYFGTFFEMTGGTCLMFFDSCKWHGDINNTSYSFIYIHGGGWSRIYFNNCNFEWNGASLVKIEDMRSAPITFANCLFMNYDVDNPTEPKADLVYAKNSYLKFVGSTFDGGKNAIHAVADAAGAESIIVIDSCTIHGQDEAGIKIIDSDLRGNRIEVYDTGEYGIILKPKYHGTLSNLWLVNTDKKGNSTPSLWIQSGGTVHYLTNVRIGAVAVPYQFDKQPAMIANIKVDGKSFANKGTATFSGDGTTTDFEIGAHGLVTSDPSKIVVRVTPVSSDAIAASPCVGYVDPSDNTKIRVKFSSAPASGSENVKIVWYAEVIS